ncbi:MAG TPA: aspartate-semialdehyde dehydrogenase, partial [Archangium sp.]|nr:aspartate-semialdehyde dehydrogenase [Archangium sp.]
MNENLRIAVVGATGVVGTEVLSTLLLRDFPAEQLSVLGSQRSEGEELAYGEETLEVEPVSPETLRGIGLVLLATPSDASRTLAP